MFMVGVTTDKSTALTLNSAIHSELLNEAKIITEYDWSVGVFESNRLYQGNVLKEWTKYVKKKPVWNFVPPCKAGTFIAWTCVFRLLFFLCVYYFFELYANKLSI